MSSQFPVLSSQNHGNRTKISSALVLANSIVGVFTENRENWELRIMRWAPLGNHEFAAALLFELHGFVQGEDRAFDFAVIRRLGGDPLQPEAGRGHQREEGAAMLGGEADNLVGNASNQRQKNNAFRKPRPEA